MTAALAIRLRAAARRPRPRLQVVDRRDAALLSIGTLASGVLAYVFNVLAARTLGPEAYGPVAVLWATMFLLAVLLFRPLEQTMTRAIADRVARGEDARDVARSVARLAAVVAGVAVVAIGAGWAPLTDKLFAGRDALTVALAAGVAGYGASYVARGLVGGVRWFGGYGLLLLADGALRVLLALPLLFFASPAIAAVAIAGAAIGGAAAPFLVRGRPTLGRLVGEARSAFAMGSAMRFAAPAAVVAASEQVLISGGPLLVLISGGEDATTAAGVIFAATLLVRAPVFLFQGVAASLLPNLTTFQAQGDIARMHRATVRVALILFSFAAVLAACALVAGPAAMRLLYGEGFEASATDLALLALGVGCYLAACTFSQAVFARDRGAGAAVAWGSAAALFVGLDLVLAGTPFHRVSVAFAAASGLAFALTLIPTWSKRTMTMRTLLAAIVAAVILAAPARADAAGLVAAYGFEETAGTATADASGSGNTGTLTGATRSAGGGKFGNALSFDGVNDLVSVTDAASLDLTTGMTLEAWVYPTTASGWRTVVMKEQPGDLAYVLYANTSAKRPNARVFTSADLDTSGTSALQTNVWTHLAATYDGSALKLYVNGVQVSQRAVTGTIVQSARPLQIGGNTIWGSEWFRGRIDEVRVYDRALSTSEIGADMATPVVSDGSPPPPPPPPPPPGNEGQVGSWSAPISWPLVTVHAQVLGDGKVLVWDGFSFGPSSQRIWNPLTNWFDPVPYDRNLFCAAHVNLPDGRSLVAGGHILAYQGLKDTSLFNWSDRSWTRGPDMTNGRWYPTTVTLADGRVLVVSGDRITLNAPGQPVAMRNRSDTLPEIYDPAANTWTGVPTGRRMMPLYPQLHVLPDGRVADVGPDMTTRTFDVATGEWTTVATSPFDGNSSVQYRPGKILKAGSWADPAFPGEPVGNGAATIDFTAASPSWTQRAPLNRRRAYHTLTVLPDGTVMAGPGESESDGINPEWAEKSAEIWNPITNAWSQMASAQVPRMYHTTQLLLPDGRVLVAGSGRINNGPNQLNAEIFSPPYLFKGTRPSISSAPETLRYGQPFTVDTPDASRIQSVALTRSGSVTHGFDFDNRYVPLTFTRENGSLRVDGPPAPGVVPPGFYMLWIVDDNGVPSVAKILNVLPSGDDTLAPTAPPNLDATGGQQRADLSWDAATDNVGVVRYNVHRSTASGFSPTAANRIGTTTSTIYADTGLSAGTYHYLVTAEDAAGNLSPASREATADVQSAPDVVAPSVALTAPVDGATVSQTIAVTADAADDGGVVGVRFRIDGADIGSEDTSTPYAVNLDTRLVPNGTHTLTAVARDAAGNSTTSASRTIMVENIAATSGPVAAYGFEEPSGANVIDASGQGNTGTLSGPLRVATAKYGRGLTFDGVNDLVSVPDTPSLDVTTGLTVEAWVYPTAVYGWRTVVLKEQPGNLAFALYASNGTKVPNARVFTSGDLDTSGSSPLPASRWSHLAMTYDGATLRLYVNGVATSQRAVAGAIAQSDRPLQIGGNAVWGSEFFRGTLDEVRIYDRALSAAEIQSDRDTPVGAGS